MRFKLDENFGPQSARLFPTAGHDVETVLHQFQDAKPPESATSTRGAFYVKVT